MNNKEQDRIKDFKILSVTILEGCNPKILKALHPGVYPFYELGLSEDFFAHHVNVSAVVGMNGAGKSSLLELIFRMINNFSAYLIGNVTKRKVADVLYFIPGIQAELHYQLGGKEGTLFCYDQIVALSYGDKKYLLSDPKLYGDKRFQGFELCYKPSATKRKEIARCFFYTVVMNYALQAYNSFDYQDEKTWNYEAVDKVGNSSTGNWINSLFHKNDGYSTPIVLNPYRNGGIINMITETNLTRTRLAGILVEAERKKREFIDGYRLHDIEYKFNPYQVIAKLSKEWREEDYISVENRFRTYYEFPNSLIRCVLDNYQIKLDESSSIYTWACIYLVYKTLAIPTKYPSYAKYEFLGEKNMMGGELNAQSDREKLSLLIKEILADKSHITTKIRQTLKFLQTCDYRLIIKENFTYSKYELWLGMKKSDTSLESTLELMPPPIFEAEIYLKKDKADVDIPFYKLSSGERQFLFMMSSIIYHVMNIKSVPTNRVAYRCINIVLDEVEMCFHPEYQRTFLYKLLTSIERLHLNTYCSFNILITTHSPFLLSDIPQSNVLYLEDGKVVDKSKMQNPFAANVNDILYQSFFLNNGFMGEFAKQKILNLVNEAGKKTMDMQKAQELIGLIGEPMLRERLQDMLEEEQQ